MGHKVYPSGAENISYLLVSRFIDRLDPYFSLEKPFLLFLCLIPPMAVAPFLSRP